MYCFLFRSRSHRRFPPSSFCLFVSLSGIHSVTTAIYKRRHGIIRFGIQYYIDIIVVVGKRRISIINLGIEFRVVPIAIFEYFLEKDHFGTIPKLLVPSEQISSIHSAGFPLANGVYIVHVESISVPMDCYIICRKGIYLDSYYGLTWFRML